ncbi:MAG: hypothetical protein OEZ65_16110, partial [Gemmatimonadota bacterium]|nr:hypothetical protein [Gemmatimonadota bacterium]
MSTSPFSLATRLLLGGAAALLLFLGVGALLPGTWEVERRSDMRAPPENVYPFLDGPGGWKEWTPW